MQPFDIDTYLERCREAQQIKCPHCGYVHDWETGAAHTSYHGDEDGPKECTCVSCDEVFFVYERVIREWDTGKTAEEAREL